MQLSNIYYILSKLISEEVWFARKICYSFNAYI